jgi:hypothetical protein
MSYTLGIPADGQSLGNSKPQVRTNFTQIFNAFALNHVPLNGSGQGKHLFVQMPEDADKVTGANEIGLYCKEAQSYANLFFRQETGGADPDKNQGAIIQMTNVAPVNSANGRSFLPGGLLIQWGVTTLDSNGQATINFSPSFSLAGVNNAPWNIQLTMATGAVAVQRCVYANNVVFDKFDIVSTNGQSRTVFWMAIGPKT